MQEKIKDINTNEHIELKTGDKWMCKDIVMNDYDAIHLVIQNNSGVNAAIMYSNEWNNLDKNYFELSEYNSYSKKFGQTNMNLILKGKIKLGMTKEMCRLALGAPYGTNTTSTQNKTRDQWVYNSKYLYFDNNILTAIQD